jgi:hypothetical protein
MQLLDHYVLGLQISVNDLPRMAVAKSPADLLRHQLRNALLYQTFPQGSILDVLEELFAIDMLHHQVDALAPFEGLEEPTDVRVV